MEMSQKPIIIQMRDMLAETNRLARRKQPRYLWFSV